MIPVITGSPPLESGEAGIRGKRTQPQVINNALQFSTNDAPGVKFQFPDRNILPGRVLAILLTGRRYTHKDAWLELGHSRLADSVWKLRRLGWPVQMIEKTAPTSDCGRTACFGIYYLEPEAIAAAGERGQRYVACSGTEVTYG